MICVKILTIFACVLFMINFVIVGMIIVLIRRVSKARQQRVWKRLGRANSGSDYSGSEESRRYNYDDDDERRALSDQEFEAKTEKIDAVLNHEQTPDENPEHKAEATTLDATRFKSNYYKFHYASDSDGFSYAYP